MTANEASTNTNILNAHKHFQNWDFNCKLAWELDFWDRFRRAVNAHDDHLDFSVEDYDAALVTLIDDVATNYVTVRQAQQQIAMAKQNVLLQTEVLKITRVFFEHGRASALDLEKAQATLSQTRATIPDFEITLRQSQDCALHAVGHSARRPPGPTGQRPHPRRGEPCELIHGPRGIAGRTVGGTGTREPTAERRDTFSVRGQAGGTGRAST